MLSKRMNAIPIRYEQGLEDYDEAQAREGRGMMEYDDHDPHDHDHDMPEQKAVKDDPWSGYYDFIINEGSFKFWAAFQVITIHKLRTFIFPADIIDSRLLI